jgi:Asp-tRNA(Asn)/Glu-tRNA(Gln) amidotransferase A subunit family amidase
MVAEGARTLQALQAAHRAQLSVPLNQLIDAGRAIGAAPLAEARAHRLRLIDDVRALWSPFDAIVTPPARGEAPATLEHTGDPVFCTIWSLLGLPAITVPAGRGPGGLPLGLQIVGGVLADAMLLSTAQWCARVLGDSVRFPTEPEDTTGSQPDNERSEQWA